MTPSDLRGEVIPFPTRVEPLAFAAGVPPFDRTNPAHVRAWNALCGFGQAASNWKSDT